MSQAIPLAQLLHQLAAAGHQPPDEAILQEALPGLTQPKVLSPWFIRLFAGASAWASAFFFVGFTVSLGLFDQEGPLLLVLGLLLCSGGAWLIRAHGASAFWGQLALALSLTGQVLAIGGFVLAFEPTKTAILTALILLEVLLIAAFASRIHRFFSTVVIFIALTFLLEAHMGLRALNGLIPLLGAGLYAFHRELYSLTARGLESAFRPVAYGTAFSFLGLLAIPLAEEILPSWHWLGSLALLAVLLWVIVRIGQDLELPARRGVLPWILVVTSLLIFPSTRMPGILGGVLVLLLGYWRDDRSMLGLGMVFWVFFLGAYYYTMELDLLEKSIALAATGLLLFLLRHILLRFAREAPQ